MATTNKINYLFLQSCLTEENPYNSTEDALNWIKQQNKEILVDVKQIPFSKMKDWYFDDNKNLRHNSGKFFSIEGLSVSTNYGNVKSWAQPIINQPEIGYLGILTKEINGILYFLLQAKVEPGNVNKVQLSPTLQATKSNYSQVHGGNKPAYLEYFQNATKDQILLDQLQSEQGARFLKKRNRNIIIKVDEDIQVLSNFIWLTLAQIKKLALIDNIVNMDTRTVISGISLNVNDSDLIKEVDSNSIGSKLLIKGTPLNSITDILSWMTSLKCQYELEVKSIPLKDIHDWYISDTEIYNNRGKYFKVIATEVSINNREVKTWTQPLVKPLQKGLTAFVIKKINGVYHFLVQAKVELGNFDIVEMAPTVQCITDSYEGNNSQPFVDYVLSVPKENIIIDTYQSEEGGRFYHEQNRNMIILDNDNIDVNNIPRNYMWITYEQLLIFLHFNNYLNIQARSLISLISFL